MSKSKKQPSKKEKQKNINNMSKVTIEKLGHDETIVDKNNDNSPKKVDNMEVKLTDLIEQQFYEYLSKFLDELSKSFGNKLNLKSIIETQYTDICSVKYINQIKQNIYNYKKDFLSDITELDDLFKNNSILFLDGINISDIWGISDSDNKSAVIQYLKVFILIYETALNDTNEDDSDDSKDSKDNIPFEEMLKKSIMDNNENIKQFCKNLENDDNSIVNLAKNIASELKNENSLDDNNDINSLLNNGAGLNGLIKKIHSKLDTKIQNGNIDQNMLLNDVQKLFGNGENNLFGNMFNNMNMNMNNNNKKSKKKNKK